MKFWIFTLSVILFSCKNNTQADLNNNSKVIYHGGTIITMEGVSPEIIESVVIDNDRILFTGSIEKAHSDFPKAKAYNLEGKTLLPGFIEPHVHPSLASTILPNEILAPYDWHLPGGDKKAVSNESEFRKRLTESVLQNANNDELYLIWGYHHLWHGPLSKSILNELTRGKAVGVIHRSFHEIYINDAAFEFLNLNEQEFIDHPQVDWKEGHFYEGGWLALIPKVGNTLFNPAKLSKGLELMSQVILQNGITTIAEPGFPNSNFANEYKMYRSLMDQNPPFDLYLIPNGRQLGYFQGGDEKAIQFIDTLEKYNTQNMRFLPKQVKLFADGAMYSQKMQMKEGYLDGHHGEWMTEPGHLKKQIELYWKNKFKIHVHANGDLGIQHLIDIVKNLYDGNSFDHRFTLHHMGYFTPDQSDEMKSLKMEASVNPYYLWALADKYSDDGLGPQRASNLVRTGSLFDRNIPVSFHSDFSMAPMEPLTLAWVAVNRKTSTHRIASPAERISVYEGLKAITINAARTLNLEKEIGSIKIGKTANFVILNENPLLINPIELKDIKVHSTVYKGKEHLAINQ